MVDAGKMVDTTLPPREVLVGTAVLWIVTARLLAPARYYFAGFFALFVLFRLLAPSRLDAPTRAYWASSAVSTAHSLIIVPLSWAAYAPYRAPDAAAVTLATAAATRCGYIYLGYILADMVPLLHYRDKWAGSTPYIFHHAFSVLCWGTMVVRGQCLGVAVGLLLLEATAPFTNGRWFLSTHGRKDGALYLVNGALMALSFFALRVCFMGYLVYTYLFALRAAVFALPPSTVAALGSGFAFGYPLQLFWFQKIATGLVKVLRGGPGGKAKKAK